jgi:hypothetical protein
MRTRCPSERWSTGTKPSPSVTRPPWRATSQRSEFVGIPKCHGPLHSSDAILTSPKLDGRPSSAGRTRSAPGSPRLAYRARPSGCRRRTRRSGRRSRCTATRPGQFGKNQNQNHLGDRDEHLPTAQGRRLGVHLPRSGSAVRDRGQRGQHPPA